MRAKLTAAPGEGPGYGILMLDDLPDVEFSHILIRRLGDGWTLAAGGWRSGDHDMQPFRLARKGSHADLWFGPQVIDELNPAAKHEIEISGVGSAPLILADIEQSSITDGDADWDDGPALRTSNFQNEINDGVEPSPEIIPDSDDGNMPAGVAAMPDMEIRPKKRPGCILLAFGLFVAWAAIAWVLWQWAMDAPVPAEDERSQPFELVPRADGS